MSDTSDKKLVIMYRPTIRIEVPFDDECYPSMTIVEALQYETSKTIGDQIEEIIEYLTNTEGIGDLGMTVAATLACFEDPAAQAPDASTMLAGLQGDVPEVRAAGPVCMIPDCGCSGEAHP